MQTEAAAIRTPVSRIRRGVREARNWRALVRFATVGASGYVINLTVFGLSIAVLGVDHRLAAVLAFLVAVTNNFFWNRHWTFRAADGDAARQARRFLMISLVAFGANLVVLEALVSGAELPKLLAQAVAIACATPINFVANKLWTFE